MPVLDPFSYSARWDSIGLDCFNCAQFRGPESWPDVDGVSFCWKNQLSLTMQLNRSGYKVGEWFCRDFEDNGSADKKSVGEFDGVREAMLPMILYGGYSGSEYLKEVRFEDVK